MLVLIALFASDYSSESLFAAKVKFLDDIDFDKQHLIFLEDVEVLGLGKLVSIQNESSRPFTQNCIIQPLRFMFNNL